MKTTMHYKDLTKKDGFPENIDDSTPVCKKCGAKTSIVRHPSKLCYDCWKLTQPKT